MVPIPGAGSNYRAHEVANPATDPKNATWWTDLANIPGPDSVDVQGVYALSHAIDQSIWSQRAASATLELIPMTDIELTARNDHE